MSVETSAEQMPVEGAGIVATPAWRPFRTVAKNLFALGLIGGFGAAYETGYFSADRITRADWSALYAIPKDRPGKPVYDATFGANTLKPADSVAGKWDLYNGARPETVTIENNVLVMKYSLAWLGVYFDHTAFEPKALYRVRFEAKVDSQPAAILMRNRQLDYMRNMLPTTGGEFKEFIAEYAAPAGRFDQVKVIFMPNGRGDVSGALTIRKFRIERLEK